MRRIGREMTSAHQTWPGRSTRSLPEPEGQVLRPFLGLLVLGFWQIDCEEVQKTVRGLFSRQTRMSRRMRFWFTPCSSAG